MPENPGNETTYVDTFLDSTLESVDAGEEMVLKAASGAGLEEDELHKIGMAVREALVNAVVHGNRYSAHKKVHLRVVSDARSIKVRVIDQGAGFDAASLPDPLAQENLLRQSGRGILLIQAFVDEVRIDRTDAGGMCIEMVKHLGSGF
jgi:serine/threonine-protein kinase RsbW